jgi:DNA recombination protein RmuC
MDPLLLVIAFLVLLNAILLTTLLVRGARVDTSPLNARLDGMDRSLEKTERMVREEMAGSRTEAALHARQLREEMATAVQGMNDSILKRMSEVAALQKDQFGIFSANLTGQGQSQEKKLDQTREAVDRQLKDMQEGSSLKLDQMREQAGEAARLMREETAASLKSFSESNDRKLDAVRVAVEEKLQKIQEDNAARLEQMRQTVDEKLQGTLEKRLGESFQLVSERLEQVHKGLGEMQTLAHGVGDLKKVLSNVKVRGNWGEVQLGNLLEQVLSPDQYAANVRTREGSAESVEFAIRLPGRDDDQPCVWLPIDAKFPQEDFLRLVEAQEKLDVQGIDEASRALEVRVRQCAQQICTKYLNPPTTTDFGIMFLPTEGLYAEVIRRTGVVELLQREHRVIVAGPTTLAAILNSLQMGFRTLAIQKRSSEVWSVLGTVKTEFSRFGGVIDKVRKKLQEATNVVDEAARRSRAVERTLRDVEELPAAPGVALLLEPSLPDGE